jgi:hypothetical protein
MKLTERYELAELLTSGRVTTFVAKDRATQEPVVVHTYECLGANAPSGTAAILTRFVSLAPNPPGMVLKAGWDDESSSAFLVTKMPAPEALQDWVRAYRAFKVPSSGAGNVPNVATPPPSPFRPPVDIHSTETMVIPPVAASPKAQPPLPDFMPASTAKDSFPLPAAPLPPQSGGEFTRLFRELDTFPTKPARAGNQSTANANSDPVPSGPIAMPVSSGGLAGNPLAANPPVAKPADSEPGEITKLFYAASKKDELAGMGSATNSGAPIAPEPKAPGSFTSQFLSASEQTRRAESSGISLSDASEGKSPANILPASFPNSVFGSNTPQPLNEEPKSGGEFTKFFRGPFDQPSAPNKPISIPDEPPPAPSRQKAGDFTMVFGKGAGLSSLESPMTMPEPEPPQRSSSSGASSFTQLFGPDSLKSSGPAPSTLDSNPSGMLSVKPGSAYDSMPPAVEPGRSAQSSPFPTPVPQFPSPVAMPSVPAVSPASFENAAVRAGRSDATNAFTMPGQDAPPMPQEARAPSEFTMFLNRKDLKAMLPPEPGEAPAAPGGGPGFAMELPKVTLPPAPKLPPVPKLEAPKLPGVKPPQTTYWPLITVFTVLLAIGAMLVMYFFVRH